MRRILTGTNQIRMEDDGSVILGGASNYAKFGPNGEMYMFGTARTWVDIELMPGTATLPVANAPAEDTKDGFSFHRYNRSTEESVYITWIIPHDFASGDNSVKGHFSFLVENPPSGGGNENVRMGFEYKKLSDGDVFSFAAGTTSGTIDEVIVDGESADKLHATADGTLTTTNWAAHDTILFRFYRDATDPADTYDNEAVPDDNDVWVRNYHLEYLSYSRGASSA